MDERERLLLEIFRVLKPGGALALSTSHQGTDVKRLLDALGAELERKGLLQELRPELEDIYDRHRAMDNQIHGDTREMIYGYIQAAGFVIEQKIDSTYVDAVFIVKARKPRYSNCRSFSLEIWYESVPVLTRRSLPER
jgi:SAM-dependent methyltransferase